MKKLAHKMLAEGMFCARCMWKVNDNENNRLKHIVSVKCPLLWALCCGHANLLAQAVIKIFEVMGMNFELDTYQPKLEVSKNNSIDQLVELFRRDKNVNFQNVFQKFKNSPVLAKFV